MNILVGWTVWVWVLGVYAVLVVISHLAWWLKKIYFPNRHLCSDAHDRFHLSLKEKAELDGDPTRLAQAEERFWHTIGMRLISQVPAELSVIGFFCTLAWPVFVLLNIVLLAQVMGTQVGTGGGVWEIQPLGTYGAIAVVTAILYALGQTGAGIMYGESKGGKRYLALTLLTLAIIAEGGLAVYRAWLIRQGVTQAGANMVDNSLESQFGLVLGAFFGIFFPAMEVSLGYVAFPRFVVPVVQYAIRLSGGLLMLGWSAANYLMLAWHPDHPKDWTRTVVPANEKAHWEDQRRLTENANGLLGYLKLLLEDLPATPVAAEDAVRAAKALLKRWNDSAVDANLVITRATALAPAAVAVSAGGGGTGPVRLAPLHDLASSHDRLNEAIEHVRKSEIELEDEAKTEGKRVLLMIETRRADLVKLQRRLEEIKARTSFGTIADGLLKHGEVSLSTLEKAFGGIPAPPPGDFRHPDYSVLHEKVTHCREAYDFLRDRWTKSPPFIPPAETLRNLRDELDAVSNLPQAYTDASKSLYESKQMAKERLRRVEGRPRWVYWLADRAE